ncbi:hypothetical protein Btru_000069 [Bulinus truncatus]|nr:hypothetical protein Btru_000069 [Bulinus truncatus]
MLASYQELLNHEDCSLEYVLNAIHLLKKYEKPDVAFHLRQEVLKKFELHPDFGMLLITLLDIFLIDSDSHLAKTMLKELYYCS